MQHVSESLPESLIFKVLGLIMRDILAPTANQFAGRVGTRPFFERSIAQRDGWHGRIIESVFHVNDSKRVKYNLVNTKERLEFDIETEEEREKSLKLKIKTAQGNRITSVVWRNWSSYCANTVKGYTLDKMVLYAMLRCDPYNSTTVKIISPCMQDIGDILVGKVSSYASKVKFYCDSVP